MALDAQRLAVEDEDRHVRDLQLALVGHDDGGERVGAHELEELCVVALVEEAGQVHAPRLLRVGPKLKRARC